MFSSSELIEALQRRLRRGRSIRPPRAAGEFPPGWGEWFASAYDSVRRTGSATAAIVEAMLTREPVFPAGYRQLNDWQAFTRLWRHDWRERPAPDRRTRWMSMSASVLLHLLWLQLMILFMVARYPGEEEAARLGEEITQVEFIGEGAPVEEGGGATESETPQPEVVASQAPAAASQAASEPQVSPPPPPPSVAETEVPPEDVPPPVAEQPLQVTETPEPDSSFVLAPPRVDAPPVPTLQTPELQAPTPEVRVVEVPTVTPPPQIRPLPRRDVNVPDIRQPEIEITERSMPAPAPEVALRAPRPVPAAPQLRRDGPAVAEREIQLRAPASGAGTSEQATTQARGASQDADGQAPATATASGGGRANGSGTSPTSSSTGAGPASTPAPGALPSPRQGTDWGDSDRNVAGGQAGSPSGLFNADGTPRLANTGKVGGGLPPGTITEDYEKIDRMGTWLKRPPVGYEPTAFDRFWVPHETLLEEWVRRSIKEVLIPIPGTGKRIKCTVAMLMLGGACGINDPNMLDNEAAAREPPDVPFKRELQEDQDSLAPATP